VTLISLAEGLVALSLSLIVIHLTFLLLVLIGFSQKGRSSSLDISSNLGASWF
jgi:hypothetical protein